MYRESNTRENDILLYKVVSCAFARVCGQKRHVQLTGCRFWKLCSFEQLREVHIF